MPNNSLFVILAVLALQNCSGKAKVKGSGDQTKATQAEKPLAIDATELKINIKGQLDLQSASLWSNFTSLFLADSVQRIYEVKQVNFSGKGDSKIQFIKKGQINSSRQFSFSLENISTKSVIFVNAVNTSTNLTEGMATILPKEELRRLGKSSASQLDISDLRISAVSSLAASLIAKYNVPVGNLTPTQIDKLNKLVEDQVAKSGTSNLEEMINKSLASEDFRDQASTILSSTPGERLTERDPSFTKPLVIDSTRLPLGSVFSSLASLTGISSLTDGSTLASSSVTNSKITFSGSLPSYITSVKFTTKPALSPEPSSCISGGSFLWGCGGDTTLDDVASSFSNPFSTSGMQDGVTYTIKLKAYDKDGILSGESSELSFKWSSSSGGGGGGGSSADTTAPTAGTFSASTSVTISGFTLNWSAASDNVSAASALQYLVCSGASAAAIDTVAECEAATAEMAYAANTLTFAISGKSVATTYYYNVIVKDEAGNKSIYNGLSQATSSDTTSPTAATFSASSGVGATGFTLNWGAATDDVTNAASLQYMVCSGASAAAVNSVSNCEGATSEMAYAANTLTLAISGKSPSTTYYYNVVVKDAAGNKSLYDGKSQATAADTTVPTAGTFSASTSVSATAFTLNWSAASDDVTAAASLQYFVCSGASAAAINSVSNCEGATSEMAYTANTLTLAISGKSPSTTYYYNVVVKDAAGNKSLYDGKSQATTADTTVPTAGSFSASTSVNATGFVLNWSAASDNVTAAASLQYFVCSGAAATDIDTVAECEAATSVMAYAANTLSLSISGKSPSTTYYYNVVVKDAAGNKSLYDGKSQATTADTTNPTAGTFSASSSVGATGFTLNWSAASDDVTAGASLQYFVCSGASAAAINSVSNCEGATSEMAYTANTLTKAITGKSPSTTYYYNVVVKDAAGNKSLYDGKSQATTADTTAPTAGTFSASTSVTSTSFTLNWSAASDDITAAASLQYFVCSGANAAAIDTVAECEAATSEMAYTANTLTKAISGKSASTTYYYNVVVKDAAGNKAIYNGISQTTNVSPPNRFDYDVAKMDGVNANSGSITGTTGASATSLKNVVTAGASANATLTNVAATSTTASGFNGNGTAGSTPYQVTLDGTNDYMSFTSPASDTKTLELWFKTPSAWSSSANMTTYLLASQSDDDRFIIDRVGVLTTRISWAAGPSTGLSQNTWYHLVVSCQGATSTSSNGTATVYLNGSIIGTFTAKSLRLSETYTFGTRNAADAYFFSGSIGRVAGYSTALTAAQVASLYVERRGYFFADPGNTAVTRIDSSIGTSASSIKIWGWNFGGATAVTVNGSNVTSYTIDNPGLITATVQTIGSAGFYDVAVVGSSNTATASSAFYRASSVTSGYNFAFDAMNIDGAGGKGSAMMSTVKFMKNLGSSNSQVGLSNFPSTSTATSGFNGTGSTADPYVINLDGTNDYLGLGSPATDTKTLEIWFKTPSSWSVSQEMYLWYSEGDDDIISVSTSGVLSTRISWATGPTSNLSLSTWYHLVISCGGTTSTSTNGTNTVYLNGTSIGTFSGKSLKLGGEYVVGSRTSADAYYFKGSIAWIAGYSTALNSTDVTNLRNERLGRFQ